LREGACDGLLLERRRGRYCASGWERRQASIGEITKCALSVGPGSVQGEEGGAGRWADQSINRGERRATGISRSEEPGRQDKTGRAVVVANVRETLLLFVPKVKEESSLVGWLVGRLVYTR